MNRTYGELFLGSGDHDRWNETASRQFETMDHDQDRSVSREEYRASVEKALPRFMDRQERRGKAEDDWKLNRTALLQQAFLPTTTGMFDNFDTNHDDRWSWDEYRQSMENAWNTTVQLRPELCEEARLRLEVCPEFADGNRTVSTAVQGATNMTLGQAEWIEYAQCK